MPAGRQNCGRDMKKALIVGVTGQDGAYLAKLLLEKGYEVHGSSRDAEVASLERLIKLGVEKSVQMHSISPVDFRSVVQAIDRIQPQEIYNFSGQSSVAISFGQPVETIESIVNGTLNLLEAIRFADRNIRFYNAGSSECFGDTGEAPADERTAFRPRSPYGIAKAASISLTANYREAYGLFGCSGLLFNHESPLRHERFVTRKITAAAARIAGGSNERLKLGNLAVRRDWGWAPDYVEAMWAMLQQPRADDFVVASGVANRLQDFVDAAFTEVGLHWQDHVELDAALHRPTDIAYSLGNPQKAKRELGWQPQVDFRGIVSHMMAAERSTLGNKR
jgi:GDPmannose 4,6-dehydratase